MISANPKILTLALFLATYILIILFYQRKMIIVWVASFLLLGLKLLTPWQAFEAIDWNVILLYFGMLLVSEVFLFSKMPDYLATHFAGRAKTAGVAMVLICLFTGFLSIALENVAVVLLVAPIALSISRKCEINPIPLITGMAVSSNLQGAATLIGDPPSMLLAGFAKMTFNDFFFIDGKPAIFFGIQIGAGVSALVLLVLFRRYNTRIPPLESEQYLSLVPSGIVILLITSLVVSSSFYHTLPYMTGLLCLVFGVISFIWYLCYNRAKGLSRLLSNLDWQTGIFLIGIFILVKSLSANRLMEDAAHYILRISGKNPFTVYMLIVWISVLLSAFIDNVPFLAAMLPVLQIITMRIEISPYLLYFGLLIGASIGGNITPIGASANIVATGILRKQGYQLQFFDFVKLGLPFTLASVSASSLFIWLVFR